MWAKMTSISLITAVVFVSLASVNVDGQLNTTSSPGPLSKDFSSSSMQPFEEVELEFDAWTSNGSTNHTEKLNATYWPTSDSPTEAHQMPTIANATSLTGAESDFNNETTSHIPVKTTKFSDSTIRMTEMYKAPTSTSIPDVESHRNASSGTNISSGAQPKTSSVPSTARLPTSWVKWFAVNMEGNCSNVISRGRQAQGEKSFKNQIHQIVQKRLDTESHNEHLSVSEIKCHEEKILVNFTVVGSEEVGNESLSSRLDDLEALRHPLLRIHEQDLYVFQIIKWDGEFLNKEPELDLVDFQHTDVELVIYIAVGSSCAFLLVLAALMLLCKYCCQASESPTSAYAGHFPKSFDLPTANAPSTTNNLRLEDYTLTRIPRPKFGYVDYYRGANKRYAPLDDKMTSSSAGMVQPFDTSVVPLEDAGGYSAYVHSNYRHSRDLNDGVIVRPNDVKRFGGSLGGIYAEGARSNERLHSSKADKNMDRGVDNPNFR